MAKSSKSSGSSGTTSKRIASQAGKDLRNPNTPKQDRGPIASALRQYPGVKPKGR